MTQILCEAVIDSIVNKHEDILTTLMNIFPEDSAEQIICKMATEEEIVSFIDKDVIKDIIGEKIIQYVTKHKKFFWDWEYLTTNKNITTKVIEEYINMPWNWDVMGCNPNINMEFVEKHIDKPWSWLNLSECINCSEIDKYINFPWDWEAVSANSTLTIEFIDKYPTIPYNWDDICSNLSVLPVDKAYQIIKTHPQYPWNWDVFTINCDFPIEIFDDFSDKLFDWNRIAFNNNLTIDFVKKYIHKDLEWDVISAHNNITVEMIIANPDLPWKWIGISMNPNVTMEIIEKYIDQPWNWEYVSKNPNLTMEMIENHPDKPWDWNAISINKNITPDVLEKYPNKPWVDLEYNRNITYDYAKKNESFLIKWIKYGHYVELPDEAFWIFKKFPQKRWSWFRMEPFPKIMRKYFEAFPKRCMKMPRDTGECFWESLSHVLFCEDNEKIVEMNIDGYHAYLQ